MQKTLKTIITLVIFLNICLGVGCDKKTEEKSKEVEPTKEVKPTEEVKSVKKEGYKVLNKPIFGVRLGQTREDLEKQYTITKDDYNSQYPWSVHVNNPNLRDSKVNVRFYNNQVVAILAYLKEVSDYENEYEAILSTIRASYDIRVDKKRETPEYVIKYLNEAECCGDCKIILQSATVCRLAPFSNIMP